MIWYDKYVNTNAENKMEKCSREIWKMYFLFDVQI